MKRRSLHIIGLLLALCCLAGCHPTKFVGEREYLLDEVHIVSDNKHYKSSELRDYVRQQPNFKVFGLMKWQLYLYSWSGRNEKKWVNKQLRRMGEPPVILDTTLVKQSEEELKRFFVNKGYAHAEVSSEIDTSRTKKAVVTYRIESNNPYRIIKYRMKLNDARIDSIARLQVPKRSRLASAFRLQSDDYTSLIGDSCLFDRDMLDKERQRITTLLRRHGYYAFNRDNLRYVADSSFNRDVVELEMLLRPFRHLKPDGKIEEIPHQPYYINRVQVVTDYDPLSLVSIDTLFKYADTVHTGGIDIIYGNKTHSVRPGVLRRSVYVRPGDLFNERQVEQTYSSFARLRSLKNINVRFDEVEVNDTMKLNCTILTTPAKIQSFGVDLEGTNSAGDLGFASSLNYQHRNLLKGSEILSAKIRGAYESLGRSDKNGLGSYWELGAETSLTFPSFVFPFMKDRVKRRLRATTEFKLSYSYQTRPEYKRAIVSGGWSYIWQDRRNTQARHIFKLLDVDFVSLPHIDEEFKNQLPESTRLYNFTDQFVMGTGYTYSFSNYTPQNRLRNTHSLRVSFETAGNLLYAVSKIAGAEKNSDGLYECFGTPYSQFSKIDLDFSKSIVLDSRNKVAYHIGVGVGYPYGNTRMLPFERSYFSGGANSVRGWSVRSLGPGSMPLYDGISFADQVGDIRLDLNLEYRTKLFWKFEMAAYIDAGNIWKFHDDGYHVGANFDFSRFYKEIAVSYGLGLRVDFDFFLLRFDTGMKAYDPQMRGSKRWAILNPNFKLDGNFAWHFAVGYPF